MQKQFIINQNLDDHEGYKGQPVTINKVYKNDYFDVVDENGNYWYCSLEELTPYRDPNKKYILTKNDGVPANVKQPVTIVTVGNFDSFYVVKDGDGRKFACDYNQLKLYSEPEINEDTTVELKKALTDMCNLLDRICQTFPLLVNEPAYIKVRKLIE